MYPAKKYLKWREIRRVVRRSQRFLHSESHRLIRKNGSGFHRRNVFAIHRQIWSVVFELRGLSGKYQAYLYISALALFFIIGRVASFKVIPTWLNNTVAAMFPLLKTVLELTFWNGLQLASHITLNCLDVVEPLSFEGHFQFWEHPKVAGSYVGTVRRLSELYNLVLHQKLLHATW